jgi:hypothetical protein
MHSDTSSPRDTRSFGLSLVTTLRDGLFENGELSETRLRALAPSDHYATTCFAVASLRAFDHTGDRRFYDAGRQALRQYLSLPEAERGHEEFNSFALLEAVEDARSGRYDVPIPEATIADRITYSADLDTREGNNWLLLQALCRLKCASLFGDAPRELRRVRRILRISRNWTLEGGIIADEPRWPLAPPQTPLTYHAKSSMLYGRLADRLSNPELTRRNETHLRAVSGLCLPDGELLYFGRSQNTIFGYASAIDALTTGERDDRPTPEWRVDAKRRVTRFLLSEFDAERLACQPDGLSDGQRMDGYVYDAVYAAYAAMVLLGLPPTDPQSESGATPAERGAAADGRSYSNFPEAGILAARGRRSGLGTATTGQIRPRRIGPDPRYAGMIPHTFTFAGDAVVPGVPVDSDDSDAVPFLPVVRWDGDRYAPIRWDATVEPSAEAVTVRGTGCYLSVGPSESRADGSDGESGETGDSDSPKTGGSGPLKNVTGWFSGPADRLLRASKLDLVYRHLNSRPARLPVRTRRTIHYLSDIDVLVVQTGTVPAENVSIRPSSVVVADTFEEALSVTYSGTPDVENRAVRTHKGEAQWFVAVDRPISSPAWSVVVLDPADAVDVADSTFSEGTLATTLEAGDRVLELRTRLRPYPQSGETSGMSSS